MTLTENKPSGLLRALFRLPIVLYRMNLGPLLGGRFLMLTHRGRKSGLPRRTVVEVVSNDEATGTYYVAAAWRERSDWYLNILKNPRVGVQVGNRKFEAEAIQTSREEAERVLWEYAQRHPVAFRELTLVMLGERLPSTRETCLRVAESVPVISLKPVQ